MLLTEIYEIYVNIMMIVELQSEENRLWHVMVLKKYVNTQDHILLLCVKQIVMEIY